MGFLFGGRREEQKQMQAPVNYGVPQNQLALQASQQTSAATQQALAQQTAANQMLASQQAQLDAQIKERTAAIQNQIAQGGYTQPANTIQGSVLGDTASPKVSRNSLLGT